MTDKLSRYEGALLGVAIGDALGAPLEFMQAVDIQAKYGTVRDMLSGGWLNVVPGEVTDDTQMTMAVAEGIKANPDNPFSEIGKRFIEWYNTNPKDIGNTCRAVISAAKRHKVPDWWEIANVIDNKTNGNTAGNGGLMRTIYPAMYYNNAETGRISRNISSMTHAHIDSEVTVFNYTTVISEILEAPEQIDVGWAKERIEFRMKIVRDRLGERKPQPSGYVIDSTVCAMNAIRDTSSFEEALIYAVNLGGDADTIGAITGGLAGAIYGSKEIPLRWINPLANARNNALFGNPESNANLLVNWCLDMAQAAYKHRNKPEK